MSVNLEQIKEFPYSIFKLQHMVETGHGETSIKKEILENSRRLILRIQGENSQPYLLL